MAEVQPRTSAPRGRGSGRGGRGGFSSRGGRGSARGGATTAREQVPEPVEDEITEEGQIGDLKKQYGENLSTLKEMFPDWTNEDLLFALQETDGDLVQTIDHISGGNVSQWGEVKKKTKEKSKPAAKEVAPAVVEAPRNSARGRGGADSVRGARGGRGTTRGRGAGRGGRGGLAAGVGKPAVSAGEEKASDVEPIAADINKETTPVAATGESARDSASPSASWEMVNAPEPEAAVEAPKTSKQGLRPDGTRSWASLMHAPKPAVPLPTKLPIRREIAEEVPETKPQEAIASQNGMDFVPNPDGIPASPPLPAAEPAVDFTPAKDELTEENLEQIKDSSQHISSQTVASTIGTDEPRGDPGSLTPLPGQDQSTTSRPGLTGYAASALKATAGSGPRTPSFVRRIQQQQESVVMPNKQSIDRTAVQFGSLGLGSGATDVDVSAGEEVPVTREQPPQHSPIAPRASLPPAPAVSTLPARGAAEYSSTLPQTNASRPTQLDEQSRYDQYGGSLGPSQHNDYMAGFTGPQHGHASAGTYGQGQHDYNYYGADSSRNAPSGYPGYGQQTSSELHSLPKTTTAAQTSTTESQSTYPSGTQAAHSRYNVGGQDVANSGHNTPAPVGQASQQAQSQQGHSAAQQQTGANTAYGSYNQQQHNYPQSYYPYMSQGGYNGYGRDRPMYDDARRYEDSYQYGYPSNQSAYGAPYSKYGQHSNYGQGGYEQNSHASSGYGRDASTYSSYGRGSTQPTETQGSLNTPSTSHAHTSEYSRQYGQGHYEESGRGYTDKASGASPAAQSSIARTDSATGGVQSSASQAQPQQQTQSQYGNYPSQQSYGYGSSGQHGQGHSSHAHHQYGQYNQQYGGNYYGGNQSRGNWGGNYGH